MHKSSWRRADCHSCPRNRLSRPPHTPAVFKTRRLIHFGNWVCMSGGPTATSQIRISDGPVFGFRGGVFGAELARFGILRQAERGRLENESLRLSSGERCGGFWDRRSGVKRKLLGCRCTVSVYGWRVGERVYSKLLFSLLPHPARAIDGPGRLGFFSGAFLPEISVERDWAHSGPRSSF